MPKTEGNDLRVGNKLLLEIEYKIADIRNVQTDSITRMMETQRVIEKLIRTYGLLCKIDTMVTLQEHANSKDCLEITKQH